MRFTRRMSTARARLMMKAWEEWLATGPQLTSHGDTFSIGFQKGFESALALMGRVPTTNDAIRSTGKRMAPPTPARKKNRKSG